MPENTCPKHCRIRLDHLEEGQNKMDEIHKGLWEEMKMKVSQKLFLWMIGIAVVILLAVFGAIYQQGGETLEKVQAAQVEQAKIQETLKNHTDSSEMIKNWIHRKDRESEPNS